MTGRLDIGKVVFGAFVIPWRARNVFVRRLGLPLTALVAVGLLWSNFPSDWPSWIGSALALVGWAVVTVFAVVVHRIVLLPDADRHGPTFPRWTRREVHFFLLLLVVGMLTSVASAIVVLVPGTVLLNISDVAAGFLPELGRLAKMYLLGRLCLVFPAIALDRPVGLRSSWRLTRGHGVRLFILVGLLPWVITELSGLLFREDAGFFETLLLTFGITALYVVEIAVISLCYRELVPTAPSSTA